MQYQIRDILFKNNLFVKDVLLIKNALYNPCFTGQFDVVRTIAIVACINRNRRELVGEREVLSFNWLILMVQ